MTPRIDTADALHLLTSAPLRELCERAHAQRMARHPQQEVTFVIDTNPNYTNVCKTACTFCSFYRAPGQAGGYLLTAAELVDKVQRARALGATTLLLQGGHHPGLRFDYYLGLISALQQACPDIHLHLFSPTEIAHFADVEGCTDNEILERLAAAGLTTMPGGGAEILVDRVRQRISPNKTPAGRWLDICRKAHRLGISTTATMTYGHVETPEDIIEHLFRLRELQDDTGGITAFIPWSMKPASSPISHKSAQATPAMYLRIIALARIVLDNVPHIQASWFSEGESTGQLALHAGADDFGGVIIEENVLFQARHALATTAAGVVGMIEAAGFAARQRTTRYERLPAYTFPPQDNVRGIFLRQKE